MFGIEMFTSLATSIVMDIITQLIKRKKNNLSVNLADYKFDFSNISSADIAALIENLYGANSEVDLESMTPSMLKNEMLQSVISIEIFISYSWKDTEIACEIENYFENTNIKIKRDKRDIEQWGSLRYFMDSIRSTDYVILIISDSFLTSINCMYEVKQLMREEKYKQRILPLVLENKIYESEGRLEYIIHWERRYAQLNEEFKKIQNIENLSGIIGDLKSMKEISHSISEFLDIIRDMNNPTRENLLSSIVDRVLRDTCGDYALMDQSARKNRSLDTVVEHF